MAVRPKVDQAWIDVIRSTFPAYAGWSAAELAAVLGQDLVNVLLKIADPKSGINVTTERGRQRAEALLKQTKWWTETASNVIAFDQLSKPDQDVLIDAERSRIANSFGDLKLGDQVIADLARVAARNKLPDYALQQLVYQTAFKAGAGSTNARVALGGDDAAALRSLAKSYNYRVSDAELQAIMAGQPEPQTGQTLTVDGFRSRLRSFAKATLPHLAEQIDAGLTLSDIAKPYRQYAADLLEKPEEMIDMFSGPFLRAFGTSKDGAMSLTDWVRQVKSDPTFGWQYTKQANEQATDIALTLARAFGKVG